ncbi:histone-lysine N-methyltransferase SETMAR [Plakobranchus ocellatus]|uniref:Histone-lysine N-methyltransferase SETMAR n=1 Tax=Plakobranchus ocellatus TaxID=259542 RepID=A0AAV4BI19_9GAST|nr:histone-lysine N-methyltransferase SETMAR [Plakobranchus ocellatus]
MEAPVLSCHKKVQSPAIGNKCDGTVFWNPSGMILLDILPKGESGNADRYCETLDRLRHGVRRKRPGLLRSRVVLQHNDATPHRAKRTKEWLERYTLDIIPHPAHSRDLAPSDFHLFGPLKGHLGGKKFEDEDEIIGEDLKDSSESIGSCSTISVEDTQPKIQWKDLLKAAWTTFIGFKGSACPDFEMLHTLGSVTAVCCVDKKGILSWPNPSAEKVLFFSSALKKVCPEEEEEESNTQGEGDRRPERRKKRSRRESGNKMPGFTR